ARGAAAEPKAAGRGASDRHPDQRAGALDLHPDGDPAAGCGSLHRSRRVAMAPALTRWAWPGAAALAFAFLIGLALHGGRPDIMVQLKPGGLMTFAPEQAREIEVRR